jgi:predicted Fe-Mo cluster-binding NifX family protein
LAKVAVATDDGKTVSQDLGRAKFFLVLTIERSKPTGRELRLKPRLVLQANDRAGKAHEDGFAKEILECVTDCQAVVAGRTSHGVHASMVASGKRIVLTDLFYVDDVQRALAKGVLDDHAERVR